MSVTEASRRIPRPHHNYVPEYQMSGIPHVETKLLPASNGNDPLNAVVDGEAQIDKYKISFDSVTRWIEIHNHGENGQQNHLRVYFNRTAALKAYAETPDAHYYLIDEESSTNRLEVKCKELYLIPHTKNKSFSASVIAGLTNVASSDFPDQQYTNGFTGIENDPDA